MTREEAKEIIEALKYSLDISLKSIPEINEIDNAISIAIKSLEAWEKVKAKIEDMANKIRNIRSDTQCFFTEQCIIGIIDKYLKEVENDKGR